MSEWLQRQPSFHQLHLLGTAVVSGLVVAATILSVQAIRKVDEQKTTNAEVEAVPDSSRSFLEEKIRKEDEHSTTLARRALQGGFDEELIREQLTRTASFLTPAGLEKLRSAFVAVVGLGGVGSHCTSALVRSGVSRIRLIDFDQVTLSSLNRHSLATLADVGTPKVHCVRTRLEAIAPWVTWECFNELWSKDKAQRLLGPSSGPDGRNPDFVVDAIDNIDSKVALLQYCYANKIKVVSSMGAGCKSDPTRVLVGDISTSLEDPLSRATRRRLKLLGINEGLPVVFSIEKPGPGKASLLPLPEEEFEKGRVGELSVLPDFRARILPVLGTMPAVFGYVAANFVIMEITGYPHETGGGKAREKLYESILAQLQASEEKLLRSDGGNPMGLRLPISRDDVGFLIDEVFRGKSVVSGLATRLTLVRWRAPEKGFEAEMQWRPQKHSNLQMMELVCMTKEEATKHEDSVLIARQKPEDAYETEIVKRVKHRLQVEEAYSRYR